MHKKEANFQTVFSSYIKAKGIFCNYEIKQTDDYLNFNDDRLIRQCDSLLAAEQDGYHWKHSDQDQRQKPFDGSNIPPQRGYIVVKFPKFFCMIPVKDFVNEATNSNRESLTQERAREIAEIIVL